jgi:hypothetical protein
LETFLRFPLQIERSAASPETDTHRVLCEIPQNRPFFLSKFAADKDRHRVPVPFFRKGKRKKERSENTMSQVTTTTTYVAPVPPSYVTAASSSAPPTYQMQGAFVPPTSESSPLLLVTETQNVTFGEV